MSPLRRTLAAVCILAAAIGIPPDEAPGEQPETQTMAVFLGTYTRDDSRGIYRCDLDLASGALSEPQLAAEIENPSFLAFGPKQRFLYAVCEVDKFGETGGGAVTAFAVDPATGALTELNAQSSGGAGPCHLVVDRQGKNVLVANYSGGSVAVLPIDGGKLKPPSDVKQHAGSSVNPQRQTGPHAHSVNVDAANRFAVVADLGLDKLLIYRFDADAGKLHPNVPPAANLTPGAGPRHFAFHPSGRWAYAINELDSTVTAFRYDHRRGALEALQTVSTLPEGDFPDNTTAEVVVHPSGKFLYGSNRGHDSIAVFAIDEKTGELTAQGRQSTGGRTPRNFAVDPTGAFLLAANQNSGTVTVHRIDPESGALEATDAQIEVPSPVCIKFLQLPAK